jgi:hypothetical protein
MAAKAYCVEEAIPPYLGGIRNKQYTHTADAFAFAHGQTSHLRNSLFCPVRHDCKEEHFNKHDHWSPRGGYHKDTVLEEIDAQCGSQPTICINAITGSNFCQGIPPPLPLTQNLLAPLQRSTNNDAKDHVEDTS